ncbi:MAG: carbon starvation CstA family protein [Rikenellaceae bacterium]
MISFLISLAILVVGYFVYGRYVESLMEPDGERQTVALRVNDGVDYVPLSPWRIFMIQFLNIAGLGPIFGAIMGAKFGAASYIWIVVGTLFAGAMHDYTAGMISLRHDGESLPESVGRYLGVRTRSVMRLFTVILMVLVAAVFVAAPAGLIASISADWGELFSIRFWIVAIFIYYIIATLVPIDKLIGHLYPLFSVALLFMAAGVFCVLLYKGFTSAVPILPEFTSDWAFAGHVDGLPIFPMMFISIACGAISGFHASQSPMMARCMTNEKQGRAIFFGAMVVEGIVALVWAAVATYFFGENGYGEPNAAIIVSNITSDWLGAVGAFLAMLGVFFAPITSGDTALRSARLVFADIFSMKQDTVKRRLIISLPLFFVTLAILLFSLRDADGFNVIWRYFAWCNQLLSLFTLMMVTVYLVQKGKCWLVSFIPFLFMEAVTSCYILVASEGFNLPLSVGYAISGALVICSAAAFLCYKSRILKGSTPSSAQ